MALMIRARARGKGLFLEGISMDIEYLLCPSLALAGDLTCTRLERSDDYIVFFAKF